MWEDNEEMLHAFLNAVREMREMQRSYFAARKQNSPRANAILNEAREAERIVDNMIRLLSDPQEPTLFDQR
jgi:hypothetical protein